METHDFPGWKILDQCKASHPVGHLRRDCHGFAGRPKHVESVWLFVDHPRLPNLGMGKSPPLIGNPYDGYINPYFWVGFNSTYRGYNTSYPFIRPSLQSYLLRCERNPLYRLAKRRSLGGSNTDPHERCLEDEGKWYPFLEGIKVTAGGLNHSWSHQQDKQVETIT